MANKFVKHIIVLLTCWCCCTAIHSQTDDGVDSSAVVPDSVVNIQNTAGTDQYNNTITEEKSKFEKFSVKEKQQIVIQRRIPDTSVQKIKRDEAFWYANKEAGKEQPEKEEESSSIWYSETFRFIFWAIVIGAFTAVVVIFLMNSRLWMFAPRAKKIQKGQNIAAEELSDNIFEIDFEERISKAINQYNYRLATRLLFLRVLRSLSERKIIDYGIDKTNMDYLFQLGNTKYFSAFAQASRTYEYVWYGNFDVQQNQFGVIKNRLDELNQKVSN